MTVGSTSPASEVSIHFLIPMCVLWSIETAQSKVELTPYPSAMAHRELLE